jgi:hypothetical protein
MYMERSMIQPQQVDNGKFNKCISKASVNTGAKEVIQRWCHLSDLDHVDLMYSVINVSHVILPHSCQEYSKHLYVSNFSLSIIN